jgi:hypothetical protein
VINSQFPTVTLAAAVSRPRLLGLLNDSGQAILADLSNEAEFVFNDAGAIGQKVSVTPLSLIGHGEFVAAGPILINKNIYQAAGGKVDDTIGNFRVGRSSSEAGADGDAMTAFIRGMRTPATYQAPS